MDFEIRCDIQKVDDSENLVFGWASVSEVDGELVVDSHGDTISLSEIEKAAYEFCVEAKVTGEMHEGEAFGDMVESLVVTPEKLKRMGLQFAEGEQEKFGWWLGFRVPPEMFAKVKSGERPAFSIHGTAIREDIA